jgi:hypothetical protein
MSNPTRAPRWVDAILSGQLGHEPACGGGARFPPPMVWADESKFRSPMRAPWSTGLRNAAVCYYSSITNGEDEV